MAHAARASWQAFVLPELRSLVLRPLKCFGVVLAASTAWAIVAAVAERPKLLHPAFGVLLLAGIIASVGLVVAPIARMASFSRWRLLIGFLIALAHLPFVLACALGAFMFQIWLTAGVESWC